MIVVMALTIPSSAPHSAPKGKPQARANQATPADRASETDPHEPKPVVPANNDTMSVALLFPGPEDPHNAMIELVMLLNVVFMFIYGVLILWDIIRNQMPAPVLIFEDEEDAKEDAEQP